MKKQEAIEKIKELSDNVQEVKFVSLEGVLNIVNRIDEPQKVVIPKHVAEWIELNRNLKDVQTAFSSLGQRKTDVSLWVNENVDLFAHSWLDGYEVEKEKLYEVIIPHTKNYKGQVQNLVKQKRNWFFCGNDVNRFIYRFTEGQIKAAGFGWVFDAGFANEVEE